MPALPGLPVLPGYRGLCSFLTTMPPFITDKTLSNCFKSESGFPPTAITSANFPTSKEPTRSGQPINVAAFVVAARITLRLVKPSAVNAAISVGDLTELDKMVHEPDSPKHRSRFIYDK